MPGFIVNSIGGQGQRYASPDANTEYFYKYTWTIDNLFQGLPSGNVGSRLDSRIHLKDATLPVFNVNKEVVTGGSLEYKFAKSVSFDDIKVTWYDTKGMLDIMKGWRARVWNPTDGLRVGREYKLESEIDHYLPHDTNSGNTHKLINSWPSIIRHGELTYTDSEVNLVEVTITYDWVEQTEFGQRSQRP